MMEHWQALTSLAIVTGFVHTLAGPDHYLPFVAMSRARQWSPVRTLVVTALCGLGHVLGSVVLGILGVTVGIAIARLELVEAVRGEVAAWLMIVFGILYGIWGLRRAARGRRHRHLHVHLDGNVHDHEHDHERQHVHVHDSVEDAAASGSPRSPRSQLDRYVAMTPWVLFTVFIFGPCEVLIPQLMFPAATSSVSLLILVVVAFGLTTIGTMLVMVMALTFGLRNLRLNWLERHMHSLAGATLVLCGSLILLGF